mmetsp:Transcript_4266/g.6484  ORF Transcript_4266/g.6484 Transcript_4266/m.6484 type:complete len:120 (-) Transcript_4266:49-408(-)
MPSNNTTLTMDFTQNLCKYLVCKEEGHDVGESVILDVKDPFFERFIYISIQSIHLSNYQPFPSLELPFHHQDSPLLLWKILLPWFTRTFSYIHTHTHSFIIQPERRRLSHSEESSTIPF